MKNGRVVWIVVGLIVAVGFIWFFGASQNTAFAPHDPNYDNVIVSKTGESPQAYTYSFSFEARGTQKGCGVLDVAEWDFKLANGNPLSRENSWPDDLNGFTGNRLQAERWFPAEVTSLTVNAVGNPCTSDEQDARVIVDESKAECRAFRGHNDVQKVECRFFGKAHAVNASGANVTANFYGGSAGAARVQFYKVGFEPPQPVGTTESSGSSYSNVPSASQTSTPAQQIAGSPAPAVEEKTLWIDYLLIIVAAALVIIVAVLAFRRLA